MKNFIRLALTGFIVLTTIPTVANAVDGDPWTRIDQSAPYRPIVVPSDDRAPRAEDVFQDLNLTAPLRKVVTDATDGTLSGE